MHLPLQFHSIYDLVVDEMKAQRIPLSFDTPRDLAAELGRLQTTYLDTLSALGHSGSNQTPRAFLAEKAKQKVRALSEEFSLAA